MNQFLQYAVLGLGPAAIYAIAALGIIVIYRGTGTLNFAHGAIALLSAESFVSFHDSMPTLAAGVLAVVVGAGVCGLISVLVMKPLSNAAPVTRLVATLGLLTLIQQGCLSYFGTEPRLVPQFLPSGAFHLNKDVALGKDRVVLLVVAGVATLLVSSYFARSRFGALTEAVAENPRAASALGHRPTVIGAVAWAIGGVSAALAGILIVPVTGLTPIPLSLLILPAFAAALLGGLRSFWLATAGAVLLGCGQAVLVGYVSAPGWSDALPFLVLVVVLLIRRSAIPERAEIMERLPRVPTGPLPWVQIGVVCVGVVVISLLVQGDLANAWIVGMLAGLVGMSVVVITGYAGQVSLAQYALVGMAALVTARLGVDKGWPFPVAAVVGVLAAGLAGLLFGIPAARARGVSLAVVTLGLGVAISEVIFSNTKYIGGFSGTPTGKPTLFGWSIAWVDHPTRYQVVLGVTFGLTGVYVAVLRRSTFGRRMLAIRGNERAASAMGVSVGLAKAQAFAIAAAIAGLSGALLTARYAVVDYTQLGLSQNLDIVVVTIIAGVGYASGGALGGMFVPSAVVGWLITKITGVASTSGALIIASSIGLLVTLITSPDGLVPLHIKRWHAARKSVPRPGAYTVRPHEKAYRADDHVLEVEGMTVRFGGTVALDNVSLTLRSGQVLGVIGPNGAGKTTLIDAISGFVPAKGTVRLNGRLLSHLSASRRARAGIARTFQGVELFDDLTVAENLSVAHESSASLRTRSRLGRAPALPGLIIDLAEHVGLREQLGNDSDTLGPGPRRLVSVLRAVAQEQPVLLLDEPAAALDRVERRELVDLIRRVAREENLAVLLIEHDVDLVISVSDAVLAIDFGQTIFYGSPQDAMSSPDIRRAYLGNEDHSQPAGSPSQPSLPESDIRRQATSKAEVTPS